MVLFLISLLFAFCCFLNYWRVVILTALQATTVVYFLCTGGNGHGVAVVWISACVCLVSACSSSWYVLYLFVRFSFGLLSTCVTTGWILEISLCEDSNQLKKKWQMFTPLERPFLLCMPSSEEERHELIRLTETFFRMDDRKEAVAVLN